MKRIFTTTILALCAVLLYAQQGGLSYDWAKKIGQSSGTGNDNVRRLVVSNGYVYIIGGFQSTVDFNPDTATANLVSAGNNDIYFAKYTTAGQYVWAKRIGGTGDDYGMSLALGNNDSIIIVGYFSAGGAIDFDPGANTNTLTSGGGPEGFVAKYDSAGNYQWARRITGTLSDYAYGVALDSSDNIFVCGTIGSTNITFEHPFSPAVQVNFPAPADMYFAKYDYAGKCLYARAFQGGATADVVARDIAVDANNDVYITGQFLGTCDFNAGAGTANLSSSVNTDVFLAKYTNAGDYVWVRAMGGTTTTPNQYDNGFTLDITPSGNIIVGGAYWGVGVFGGIQITAQGSTLAGFFCSWTPAGTCSWARGISGAGTSNQAQVYQITHDDASNVYVTGRFTGAAVDFDGSPALFNIGASPSTANDIFIAKYDSVGNFTWVTSMGSSTTDEAFVIDLDDSANVYTGGYFTGTADFDPSVAGVQTLTSSSLYDAYIARHSPCNLVAPASITGLDTACLSLSGAVYTAAPVAGATSYTWTLPSGWTGSSTTNTIAVTSNTTSGTISVRANTPCGISTAATKLVTLTPGPSAPTSILGGISTPCVGGIYSFSASGGSGGNYYVWNVPAGATILSGADSIIITIQMPYTTGATSISVARANICDTSNFATRPLTITGFADGSVSPASPTICAGSSVTLTASVFSPTSYSWSNGLGLGATKTVSPASTTTYTVTMNTNSGQCADVDTVTVTVVPAVTAAISPATVTICNGQSATLTASGGTTYAWSNSGGSNATATFSPTTNTTYTVTVSDGTCSATASRLVTVNSNPTAGITPASVTICAGGTATLTATGGGTYAWSNGGGNSAQAVFSPNSATTYTVTVTNANNCSATASRLVNVNALPSANIQPASVAICTGQSATLTASGGGTYAWSNSGGSNAAATFSPNTTTTYTVTVTGANTCSATATATVTVNQLPTAAIAPATVTICAGDAATLTASGGTAYSWSNSGGSNAAATFSPTTNTTYTVTVTDGNSCSATASRLVTVNSIPSASISPVTATICNGASATLTASGGINYAWSNSGGSNAAATFSPTSTTTYTVTVSNGTCSATATRVVTVNALPPAAIAPASVAVCLGSSATLTASGGTTYAWSNSGGSNAAATFSPATTTTYTVTVTDGNNCSTTATRQVTVNQLPVAGINPSSVTICSGASQNLIASGGASYNWSNQLGTGSNKLVLPVATTTYTVTVTDANSCSATASSVVTVNPITNITTEPVSQTACTGSAVTFNVAAAGVGLTYQWKKDGSDINLATASTYNIPSLTINDADDYSVVVTGTCGADTSTLAVLSVVTSASISQQPLAQAVCVGAPLTLSVVGSGGNNTTYVWRRGSTVLGSQTATLNIASATANDAGPYSVVISGSCGTVTSDTVLVTVNNNPVAAISGNATICTGASTTLTATGGSSYAWSNSLGSNAAVTVSPATATTYTVTVTQNNCSATASQLVTVNQLPVAAISPASVTLCAGASATLTASGGTSYLWNTNNTTAAITVSPGTTNAYAVTVTDANNCSATAQRTITVNPLPVAAISPSSVAICLGGSQTLTASGGASYVWSGSLTANAIQNLSPTTTTTYTTTVTDANNCSATASATITVNSTTAAINGPSNICSGLSATLTASGGGTYSWSNSETTAAITVTPVSATTYTVTVTANNCTATASQTVSVQNTPTASITGSTSVCAGGSVSLTANGGNTYTWGNGLGTNSTITVSPATTTTYTVTASLGANCSASATHTIAILQPSASAFSQTICAGNSYSFNGESLTQSGAYNDTLVNAVGCDSVITLNLTVSPALTGDFSETICNGSSYTFFAQTLTQSGNYTETVQTQDGCDSIITLHLTVLAPITTTLAESICQGGSYDFNGDVLTIAGVYADTLASAQSCDSIVTLTLTIVDATAITTQPASTLTVCSGEAIDLNVAAAGGSLNYQWWKNDTLVSGAEAASFNIASSNVSDAGTYKVEVTGTCGTDTSDAAVVVVNATPAPVVQQNNAVLTSSVTGSSYQWYLDGGPISLATAQTYTATQTGDYKVDVTSADGCTGTSAEVNVIISGIANVASASIAVYPNPATHLLIIKSDVTLQAVEVHNVLGAKVLAETGNLARLDVNMLAQGSYVISLHTANGVVKKSFIKE
ncbi:MAG TPA: T9SS type A sorting domain-containing protein [Chitinophagales bacterium]|nr:T9SS type A sorting domain-containing protein [Chitinophagales bacterium]